MTTSFFSQRYQKSYPQIVDNLWITWLIIVINLLFLFTNAQFQPLDNVYQDIHTLHKKNFDKILFFLKNILYATKKKILCKSF